VDRDDVTSAGLTAIGVVAGTVARAVAVGGRLLGAGLGTLENVLRGGEESVGLGSDSRRSSSARRSQEDSGGPDEDDAAGFAPLSEPAFEPADGITSPARPARSVTRRSSAGAAARTAPGPRPAKRATARSLPPNLRPVEPREQAPEPAPVKGAAGAADVAGVRPAGTAKKATAKKATKKATVKKATAKKAAKQAPETPPSNAAAQTSAATQPTTSAAKKNAAKKAAPAKSAAEKAAAPESASTAAASESASEAAASTSAVEQGPATDSAASAHTRPEGTPPA
jgi:hypothetical protein